MRMYLKCAICILGILLVSCTSSNTPKTPSVAEPRTAVETPESEAAPQPAQTPATPEPAAEEPTPMPEVYNVSPDAVYDLKPAADSGLLFPFQTGVGDTARYGLCDTGGQVVVHPVYGEIKRVFYGQTQDTCLYQMIEYGAQQELTLARPDGSVVFGPYPDANVIDLYSDGDTGYATLSSGGKYGVLRLDAEDGLIADFEYETVSRFSEGLAAVKKDGVYRYIDGNGTVVLFGPYEQAGMFSEGKAVVCSDSRWGVIGRDGYWILTPGYEAALSFGGGVSAVRQNGLWGLIDQTGAALFPFDYSSITKVDTDVYKLTRESTDANGETISFFYDTQIGKVVQTEESDKYLSDGVWLRGGKDRVELIVERDGTREVIIGAGWVKWLGQGLLEVGTSGSTGLYKIGKGYILQPDGNTVFKVWPQDGLVVVSGGGRYGLYTLDGTKALPVEYDWVQPLGDGLCAVRQDGYCGIVDSGGQWLLRLSAEG